MKVNKLLTKSCKQQKTNSILEVTEITGNKSDSETSPIVTPQNIEEENNVQDSHSRKLPEKDADIDQNKEINIHVLLKKIASENTVQRTSLADVKKLVRQRGK